MLQNSLLIKDKNLYDKKYLKEILYNKNMHICLSILPFIPNAMKSVI